MKSSMRNQMTGCVCQIHSYSGSHLLFIQCSEEVIIKAHISDDSFQKLDIHINKQVMVMIKASSISIFTEIHPLKLSAENQISGQILSIEKGAVSSIVKLRINPQITLCASITLHSSETLTLEHYQPAVAVFNASQVVLAVL